ncbi:thioredoxin reductase (NADPH) [Propionispira arboris]|uniref:Thioredoxin reductase (NADPH) n=1 Tax=Propionispira arboris TaxID=84035 RepID=A0A1H6ZHF5_9FIRM|nr:FAD-dependent oxidoreductase [Propionispira arboris]SEJ51564.1 thioredoxin reductase (NADPH) [Propionispira arboris]
MQKIYDLIIIGGGCAGLSAGIYAGRAKLNTLLIERDHPGGQTSNTNEIANYPGVRKITGPQLMQEMQSQMQDFAVSIVQNDIQMVDFSGDVKRLYTADAEYNTRAVIIATGATPKKIGFPGEVEFTGKGIGYCATCDGEFFSGLDIFVIGGGYVAAEEAVYLTRYGKTVTIVMRGKDFSCAKSIADRAKEHPKIKVMYNTVVREVQGADFLEKAVFFNTKERKEIVYEAALADKTFGLFVFAGYQPATSIFKDQIILDTAGYIPTDEFMQTNVPGVYAAGDLRSKSLRQIVTAVADGAIAATAAEKYIAQEKERLGIVDAVKSVNVTPAKLEVPLAVKGQTLEENPAEFIPAEMKKQLTGLFAALVKDISIVSIYEETDVKSMEMVTFLKEISVLSDKITLLLYRKNENTNMEKQIGFMRMPIAAFLNEKNEYVGIKFSGIPGGHEMTSFVLAVYNLAGPGQKIELSVQEKIEKIIKPTRLEVFVSLSCHFCPDVVSAGQKIASIQPLVETEMIDISLFPELKQKLKIMSVPAMSINGGKIIFGAKKIDEIVDQILQEA